MLVFDTIDLGDEERDRRYARHRRLSAARRLGDRNRLEAELTDHLDVNKREVVHRISTIHQERDDAGRRSEADLALHEMAEVWSAQIRSIAGDDDDVEGPA